MMLATLATAKLRQAFGNVKSSRVQATGTMVAVLGGLVRRAVEAARALRKDLAAVLGDPDRMLELGGKRAVAGDGGPAVFEQLYVGPTDVDHRFHGEDHSWLQLGAGAGASGVDDLGTVMEEPADSVPAEIANDAVALRFGVALDRIGDIAEIIAGPGLL